MSEAAERETLVEAAIRVLNTADPFEKARLGNSVANAWLDGSITRPYDPRVDLPVPDRPTRLAEVKLVSPGLMPKLGKARSLQSRQAIVHSLAHTESWAIDLSWFAKRIGLQVVGLEEEAGEEDRWARGRRKVGWVAAKPSKRETLRKEFC